MGFESRVQHATFDRTGIDVAAVHRVADQLRAAAELIDRAVCDHLAALAFSGATAGRAYTARGDALRARAGAVGGAVVAVVAGVGRDRRRAAVRRRTLCRRRTVCRGADRLIVADRLDVAERLAEGRVAIEHTQVYVRACQTLGYEHPDLTSHPSQIRDWLDSEDGLDLRVLDRDCAELRAAGAAAAEGLRIQHAQVADLTAAWTGAGSDSAVAFLQRHCDAANMVATEVRAAAQRCESLRDNLWYLLDSKVGTAIAIDDRSLAQRSAWLAAAAVVTAGAGERSTAQEVVHEQMTPYVDNDIRNDWLTAMRSSLAAFGTAYDMVNDRMAAVPAAYFEFPGDLGPGFPPSQPTPPSAPTLSSAPAVTVPAAVLPSVAADPAPAPAASAPAPSTGAPGVTAVGLGGRAR